MIEGGVKDVGRRHADTQQGIRRLQQQRRLADLARTGKQYRPRCRRRHHPCMQLAKRRTAPGGQVGHRLASPPRVELGENGDEFFLGDLHVELGENGDEFFLGDLHVRLATYLLIFVQLHHY